jgi:hypothetical protein
MRSGNRANGLGPGRGRKPQPHIVVAVEFGRRDNRSSGKSIGPADQSGAQLAEMTGSTSSSESSRFPVLDFDALYRGESPAEGIPAVATPPWDTKAPKENVIAWLESYTEAFDTVVDSGMSTH